MLRLYLTLALVCSLLALGYAGKDEAWCDVKGETSIQPDFILPGNQYQAVIERNDLIKISTEVIVELYDGQRDIGISTQTDLGTTIKTYSYYRINELLVVTQGICKAYPLDKFYSFLTPFLLITDADGKEKIQSPLNYLLSQKDQPLFYYGEEKIRGIDAKTWKACLYDATKDETQRVTISFSNGDKWNPAATIQDMKTTPLQILIDKKKANSVFVDQDKYSIHEFRPFLTLEEEGYFTAPGTYCPGRQNMKELPGLPRHFEFLIQSSQSGLSDGISGAITETQEFFDYDAKLFKMISTQNNREIVEVHDFATGLIYKIDSISGNCSETPIDPNGIDAVSVDGLTNIRNPEQFFDFDNVNYQYNGERRMMGVNVDTWIGQKVFKGFNSTFEWSFLSKLWNKTDDLNKAAPSPVRLTITLFIPNSNNQGILTKYTKLPIVYNFLNFRVADSINTHHDVSQCSRGDDQHETFQVSFSTTADVVALVKKYPSAFQLAAYRAIQKKAKVVNIRLNKFEVGYEGNNIFFIFRIAEKSKRYGNVLVPLDDVSLEDAEWHLTQAVLNNELEVVFEPTRDKFVNPSYTLKANPLSFARIENQDDGFQKLKSINRPQGYSGATVGVVSTIVAVLGLVLVMTLLTLHKNQKITIPFIPSA